MFEKSDVTMKIQMNYSEACILLRFKKKQNIFYISTLQTSAFSSLGLENAKKFCGKNNAI